jgi:hypothetical protein
VAHRLSSPAEHGDFLHGAVRRHTVILWDARADSKRWTKVEPTDDLAQILSAHVGQPERYLTVNQFHQWRTVRLLRSLHACYVDIDGSTDWPGVLDALSGLRLPSPSLLVESGRGLHLYWKLQATPSQALPVWQAIQDELIRKLTPFGADAAARDCARVLRLVGSVNSKNNAVVRGRILSPQAWTLHELADEVLGPRKKLSSAKVIGLERTRSKRQASVHQRTGPYRLWHQRYQDLNLIAEHHAFMRPQGIEEGNRDKLLFLLAVALSWFTAAETLEDHIQRVAKTYMPSFTEKEVTRYMQQVVTRALEAKAGEFRDWNGKLWDPRYFFRTETIRSWLRPLITPELEKQLLALGPPKSTAERSKTRKAQKAKAEKTRSRVQEGRYSQTRTQYMDKAADRAQTARDLRESGLSQTTIAAQLGFTQQQVSNILRGYKCAPVLV